MKRDPHPTPLAAGPGLDQDTEAPDVVTATAAYAQRFAGPGGRFLLDRQTDGMLRLLTAVGDRHLDVLDVGGGHGQIFAPLVAAGHRVVVHGSRPSCLKHAESITVADSTRCSGVVSSLWQQPFPEGSFDLVTGIRLMAHAVRWRELMAEMTRVSRRFVLIEFPLAAGAQRFSNLLFDLKRKLEPIHTRPFFLFRRSEISQALEECNLRLLGADGQLVLPAAFHRRLANPARSRAIEQVLGHARLDRLMGSPVLLLAERRDHQRFAPAVRIEEQSNTGTGTATA